eukprot:COSAG02_NODE_12365_length_1557_cov_3.104938_3_plen_78_part_00
MRDNGHKAALCPLLRHVRPGIMLGEHDPVTRCDRGWVHESDGCWRMTGARSVRGGEKTTVEKELTASRASSSLTPDL